MPTVEDYFDDDTDIPLPSSSKPRNLPNTGIRGALLEEINSDDENEIDYNLLAEQSHGGFGEDAKAPPPSSSSGKGKMMMREDPGELRPSGGQPQINPNTPMGGFMGDMMKLQQAEEERMEKLKKQFGSVTMSDPSVYKEWNAVYPIYFDAKVSVKHGRRVSRKESVWWPQATQIAKACRVLGLPSVLEPDRCHPADWENPGRVKVQISKDGRFINPIVKNRTQLCHQLASQIQHQNPTLIYKPRPKTVKPAPTTQATATPVKKPKTSSKSKTASTKRIVHQIPLPSRPSAPPHPIPSLDDRLPLHSPIHAAGVAVSAIARDIETEKENKKKGITTGAGEEGEKKEKQPKVKRIMVRGGKR